MVNVSSVIVSLSLDFANFNAALGKAMTQIDAALAANLNQINTTLQGVSGVMTGFAQGLVKGMGEVAQSAEEAALAIREIGNSANGAANNAIHVESKAVPALKRTEQQTTQVPAKIKNIGSELVNFGKQCGGMLRKLLMDLAAPVLSALDIGSMVNSYFSGVAQVAQMTGQYSTEMEEWRAKRELLSRVTKEDVELYRKGKLALLEFNFSMQGLTATIMRALAPAINGALDILKNAGNWIRANEANLLRFFQALAIAVSSGLIPAFIVWGKVLLANPITWIIAAIAGLALIIDDLLTYIHGGDSLFASFWSKFGTGAEVVQKIGNTLENLKRIGVGLFNLLLNGSTKFFSYLSGAAEPIIKTFASLINMVADLVEGNFSGALDHFLEVINHLIVAVVEIFGGLGKMIADLFLAALAGLGNLFGGLINDFILTPLNNLVNNLVTVLVDTLGGLGKMIADLFMAAFNGLGEAFGNFISGLINKALMWIKGLIDKIPDWMKPDSLIKWSASLDAEVKERAAQTTNSGSPNTPASQTTTAPDTATPATAPPVPDTWDTVLAAIPPSATNNQTRNVETNTTVQNMTINAPGADAQDIMQNAATALQQASASLNTAAADGSVR